MVKDHLSSCGLHEYGLVSFLLFSIQYICFPSPITCAQYVGPFIELLPPQDSKSSNARPWLMLLNCGIKCLEISQWVRQWCNVARSCAMHGNMFDERTEWSVDWRRLYLILYQNICCLVIKSKGGSSWPYMGAVNKSNNIWYGLIIL